MLRKLVLFAGLLGSGLVSASDPTVITVKYPDGFKSINPPKGWTTVSYIGPTASIGLHQDIVRMLKAPHYEKNFTGFVQAHVAEWKKTSYFQQLMTEYTKQMIDTQLSKLNEHHNGLVEQSKTYRSMNSAFGLMSSSLFSAMIIFALTPLWGCAKKWAEVGVILSGAGMVLSGLASLRYSEKAKRAEDRIVDLWKPLAKAVEETSKPSFFVSSSKKPQDQEKEDRKKLFDSDEEEREDIT